MELVLADSLEKMDKALQRARADFSTIRTGRASSALVERIPVEAYGETMQLQQLASFAVPEARQLLITPYDKSNMGAVERAIQHSDLGLNPSNDGQTLRLSFPPLTQERRKELVRVVKAMAEDGRIAIRNARREGRKELEAFQKDGEISEDDLSRAESELDKITQSTERQIDGALDEKEADLLEV